MTNYSNFVILILIALSIGPLTSCNKNKQYQKPAISSFDISTDDIAYIIEGSEQDYDQKLYKVDKEGNVELVEIESDSKNPYYENFQVSYVSGFKSPYLLVEIAGSENNQWDEFHFINKETKTSVPVEDIYDVNSIGYDTEADDLGNVYYISYQDGYRGLYKFEGASGSISEIGFSEENVVNFTVDNEGNILYQASKDYDNYSTRYRTFDGSVTSISNNHYSWNYMWKGPDQNIYFLNDGVSTIDKTAKTSKLWSEQRAYAPCGWEFLETISDANVMIGIGDCDYFVQCFPEVKNMKYSELFNLEKISSSSSSKDYLYVVGQSINNNYEILKIDPKTYSFQSISSSSDEFVSISASEDDEIVIHGINLSDQTNFIAKVDFDSQSYTVKKTFSKAIKLTDVKN